jgi:hypothetical protein
LHRGDAYPLLGHFNQAVADYTAALRLNPANPLALVNRGTVHRLQLDPGFDRPHHPPAPAYTCGTNPRGCRLLKSIFLGTGGSSRSSSWRPVWPKHPLVSVKGTYNAPFAKFFEIGTANRGGTYFIPHKIA